MLPEQNDESKFNRSLETGRPYTTNLGWKGEPSVSVRALGRLSSAQFTMMARPSEYSDSWLNLDEARGQRWGVMNFHGDDPEYQELEQRIMKEGIRRPVIIGEKHNMMVPGTPSNPTRIVRTPAHPVLDGHHRAFYAIKHGLHIPVAYAKGWK